MHADGRTRSQVDSSPAQNWLRPRVVVLDDGESARVEVLELPESTSVGGSFSHGGRWWRVTGHRTGARVLIAKPEQH
jgi:hypothetical protein